MFPSAANFYFVCRRPSGRLILAAPTIIGISLESKSLLRNWRISTAAYQVEIYLSVSNLHSDEATTTLGEDALFPLQQDFGSEQSHDTALRSDTCTHPRTRAHCLAHPTMSDCARTPDRDGELAMLISVKRSRCAGGQLFRRWNSGEGLRLSLPLTDCLSAECCWLDFNEHLWSDVEMLCTHVFGKKQ